MTEATMTKGGMQWLTRGTIAHKLQRIIGISTGISILLCTLAVIAALWGMREASIGAANDAASQVLVQVSDEAGAVAEAGFKADGNTVGAASVAQQAGKATALLTRLETINAEYEVLPPAEVTGLRSDVEQLASAAAAGNTGADKTRIIAAAQALGARASTSFHALQARQSQANESVVPMTQALAALYVLLAIGAIVNFLVSRKVVAREIIDPILRSRDMLLRVVEKAEDHDHGELVILDAERTDEIGEMARAMQIVRNSAVRFRAKVDEVRETAKEQLEQQRQLEQEREANRVQHAELLRQLADRFELSVGEVVSGVAAASNQLQTTASSMAATAEQSTSQAMLVSQTLTDASAGVTAAAAASDEFAMSIGEISRQAATSAELARQATVAASDADSTISALSASANQVSEIVELISSIAQRTNLLALNASIEAARGGEAGRGFAVVASEVKELATQTGKATEEVSAQIRTIQDTTTASVDALRGIVRQIQQLEATSVSIAAAVDQQSVAGQDLARSIDLAARNTEDVSANISQVRETSLATGAAASQVLSSSQDLQSQASTLKSQVSQFLSQVRAA